MAADWGREFLLCEEGQTQVGPDKCCGDSPGSSGSWWVGIRTGGGAGQMLWQMVRPRGDPRGPGGAFWFTETTKRLGLPG